MEVCLIMILDSLTKTKSALWMGIMICCHRFQSLFSRFPDPWGWGKVHVPLTKVDAIGWKIRSTGRRGGAISSEEDN